MFKKLLSKIIGDPNQKILDREVAVVHAAEAFEPAMAALSDDGLREKSAELRTRHENGTSLDDLLPEAFALVREASRRSTGMRHYDVQIMGGSLMHQGYVIEMRTGEGKTLVATLPLYLNALTGRGTHLVTVNDYLARRDGGWMGKIFHFLGLSVGCIGPQQFSALFDPDYVNPGADLEDERLVHWRPCTRAECYRADITYGTASEFGFDYLRDNMVTEKERLVQREQHYAIIDEVDNILIDEARTPLIISGPAARSGKEYTRFAEYVRGLRENTAEDDEDPNGHYDIDHKSRTVTLTDLGIAEVERRVPEIDVQAGDSLYDPRYYTLTYYLDNAMKAEYLFHRDKEYIVSADGEVLIVDEMTGRLMPGRRYSDGLHEAIEAKEGVEIKRETITVATITLQNYFRMYEKLAGMTGTAMTDAEEFDKIYGLGVFPLPTNVQYIYDSGKMKLRELREKLDGAEKVTYVNPDNSQPVFYKRVDFPDQVYGTTDAKDRAIVAEVKRVATEGRPVLVGTTSVEHSEVISRLLRKEKIAHNVLNAKIHQSEALVVAQAGRKGAVTISTNMAGRGTDILLGGNPEGLASERLEQEMFNRKQLSNLLQKLVNEGPQSARSLAEKEPKLSPGLVDGALALRDELDAVMDQIDKHKLDGYLARELQTRYAFDIGHARQVVRFVQAGMLDAARDFVSELGQDTIVVDETERLNTLYSSYENARKHPLHTANFLAEQLFERHYNARAALIRAVLSRDVDQAREIVATVPGMPPEAIDIVQRIVRQSEGERREVWGLGGLHVVGSERHESRRIDNQLRGRAARQGDPGSSRFFLSLDDDLMLRFGGERLNNLMNRINIPEDMPIESGVLDRLIESSQSRLEGYNFDIRKNLVEYDDVMNRQRATIYAERRAILLSEDLDLDGKIDRAFQGVVGQLANNYLDDYLGYAQGEITRAIAEYSTDATGDINVRGVMYRLRALLPDVVNLQDELPGLNAERMAARLLTLAEENLEKGTNVYQLLQAMGSFLPLMPAVPNVAVRLSSLRSGRLPEREALRRAYVTQLEELYNGFLAQYVAGDGIWQRSLNAINEAFVRFNVERASVEALQEQQPRFKGQVEEAVSQLLLDSLSELDSDQLVAALNQHIKKQAENWRKRIGDEEYRNYQRLLLISAIDREWRDYLTAMDDLRREIGLAAIAQRDPKVEYQRRSFEMFQDMRGNIDRDVVNRFFSGISAHERFVAEQLAAAERQFVLNRASGDTPEPKSSGNGAPRRVRRREAAPAGVATTPQRPARDAAEKPPRPKRKFRKGRR